MTPRKTSPIRATESGATCGPASSLGGHDERAAGLRPLLEGTDRVELVPAGLAKGLEYDHVIVVEPAEIVTAPATGGATVDGVGLRHLHVALTRAVLRLTVVHAEALPPRLDG